MNNSETIEQLKYIRPKMNDLFWHLMGVTEESEEAIDASIKAIEENIKLKTEIESLKDRLEIKDNNFELYCDLVEENEKLYAELGKMGWKNE